MPRSTAAYGHNNPLPASLQSLISPPSEDTWLTDSRMPPAVVLTEEDSEPKMSAPLRSTVDDEVAMMTRRRDSLTVDRSSHGRDPSRSPDAGRRGASRSVSPNNVLMSPRSAGSGPEDGLFPMQRNDINETLSDGGAADDLVPRFQSLGVTVGTQDDSLWSASSFAPRGSSNYAMW